MAMVSGRIVQTLPVQPQNNVALAPAQTIAPPVAAAPLSDRAIATPVMNNTNELAPPIAPIAPPVAPIAAPVAMPAKAPIDVTAGATNMQQPVVQNPQNGYLPGPQQIQNIDGEQNNVHFGQVDYDPFATLLKGRNASNAWK
jgi:hypothetical protein